MKFSQRAIEELTENGKYTDPSVPNLVLRVRQPYKAWVFRRQCNNKNYELGLGGFPRTSLSQAKKQASYLWSLSDDDFLKELDERSGKKKTVKPENEPLTFRRAAQMFVDWNLEVGNWEELDKAHRIFNGRMRMYVFPKIGDKPLNEIQASDVAEIAVGIWNKPATVDRCLRLTRHVFDWAKAKKLATIDNPADRSGALKYLLPQQRHVTQNRGAISVEELPDFFKVMYDRFHDSSSGRCFLFSVLTATRSGTARAARWEQVDLEAAEWLIPPEQLKMSENGSLLVPLAPEVIELLKSWEPKEEGLIFPNTNGTELSDSMVSRLISKSGHDWLDSAQTAKTGKPVRATLHGVARATFRTWAQDDRLGNDKRFDARIAELCLHHKVQDLYNGAYERNQSYVRRREMMSAWASYCFSKVHQ